MYTLVVIDMQDSFGSSRHANVIKACQREIKLAIRRKYAIIFLEFEHCGSTNSALTNLVQGYDKVYFKTKPDNDGSYEVNEVIKQYNLYHNVRVVGVNTSYCVYDTVEGLRSYCGSITVVADACNCEWHELGLQKIAELIGNQNIIC